MKLEYESRESQQERKRDADPTGHRRLAAGLCAVAAAIIWLGGAVMVGTSVIAGHPAGEIPFWVGLFSLAVSGLFFIGCVAFASRK